MSYQFEAKENSFLMKWTVNAAEAKQRLDLFLKGKYKKRSREFIKKAIQKGRVSTNNKLVKPGYILREKDVVSVLSIKGKEPPVDFNYKRIHEDKDILVIDKPGNLPVHPSGRFFFNTLLTNLRTVEGNKVNQSKEFYITHRLDRETSGLLVLAKNKKAAASLVDQFYKRKPKKEYMALVHNIMKEDKYIIDLPLAKDPYSKIKLRMHVVKQKDTLRNKIVVLKAKTFVQVEKRFKKYTLVRVSPHTGRQHQIRVHLDHVGHPVVGDKLYGVSDEIFFQNIKNNIHVKIDVNRSLSRQALHASKITFFHPSTNKLMSFSTDFSGEVKDFIENLECE